MFFSISSLVEALSDVHSPQKHIQSKPDFQNFTKYNQLFYYAPM